MKGVCRRGSVLRYQYERRSWQLYTVVFATTTGSAEARCRVGTEEQALVSSLACVPQRGSAQPVTI